MLDAVGPAAEGTVPAHGIAVVPERGVALPSSPCQPGAVQVLERVHASVRLPRNSPMPS